MAGERTREERQSYLSALCRAIPYHVVEAVLADPSEESLKRENFEGTVLHIDLVGFTAMCERLAQSGPSGLSHLSTLLDHLFEGLEVRAIFPYHGYIVQFSGDAMAVVFRGDDHARRALAAAVTIKRMTAGTAKEKLLGPNSGDLMLRMGIASGPVQFLVLGDISRRVSACGGLAIHRAIELQKQAEPGQIVCDQEVVKHIGVDLVLKVNGPGWVIPKRLANWPERVGIDPLEERLVEQTEEKIRLLEPFLPEPLAARMRSAPEGWRLQAEIRRVVILFADFEGFAGHTDPVVAENLSRSMLRAFRKYDGVVLKSVATDFGHRVLVLYGLHRPADNDTERALLAGLEACTRLKSFVDPDALPLTIRVGVHVGDVYLGAIGAYYKHDMTVIGNNVNVCVHATRGAEPNEVRATSAVIDTLGDEFDLTECEPTIVEGRGPVAVHRVHSASEGRSHYVRERAQQRFCAGREDETLFLNDCIDRALNGEGRLLGIVGEPGAGKSAVLANAVDRWIAGNGIGVVGRCRFATQSQPLAPVVDMFSTFFGLSEADNEAQRVDRIRERLSDFNLQGDISHFLSLLQPVTRPDGTTESLVDLADIHARDRVLGTIVQFIDQRVEQLPVMYVIEDLHLADTLTLELIRRVATLDRDRHFMFIATYRPEELLTEVRDAVDDEIHLGSLELTASGELIAHEMESARVEPQLAEFLWKRTSGNPEHLVQIVRFLADRLLLNVKGDTVVAAEPGLPMLEDVVPQSWSHVALARLEGLGEVERKLLRTASAIGQQFAGNILKMASGVDDEDLVETAVSALEAQEVIALDDEGPKYRFRDDIIRTIAYSMIPEEERLNVHRRIADALESQPESAGQAAAAALAHHRERAGQIREALVWYERVARMAARGGMDREARYFAERWHTLNEQLPQGQRPGRESAARMSIVKLVAVARQGRPQETLRLARRLALVYQDVLDDSSRNVVDLLLGEAQLDLGKSEEARQRLDRIYLNTREEAGIRCDAANLVSRIYQQEMNSAKAGEWLRRALDLGSGDEYRLTRLKILDGDIKLDEGHLDASLVALQEAHDEAQGSGRVRLTAMALRSLGRYATLTQSFGEALELLNKAILLDRRMGNTLGEAKGLDLLGKVFVYESHHEAALRSLQKALRLAQDVGDELTRASVLAHLGAAVALTLKPVEGADMVREGYALAKQYGLKHVQIEADLIALRVALAREDKEGVKEAFERCQAHKSTLKVPLYQRRLFDLAGRAKAFF